MIRWIPLFCVSLLLMFGVLERVSAEPGENDPLGELITGEEIRNLHRNPLILGIRRIRETVDIER